jgi:CheY-like chemotaxis protein
MRAKYVVLIIDDEETDRELIKEYLAIGTNIQIDCHEVDNCADALHRLEEERFDCVFLDFVMSGGDGLNFLTHEKTKSLADTPIVFMTGYPTDTLFEDAKYAGAHACIGKDSMTPETLCGTFEQVAQLQ